MSQKDMFLKLESARAGPVKGEARDPVHEGEMTVLDWSWGMRSGAMSGAGSAVKTALSELRIVKLADSASTGLMSVMRNNDLVKKAVLSVRKAGGTAIDYFVVTVERGRITSYEVDSASDAAELTETLLIAFEKIEVEYHSQDATGARLAGSTFSADVGVGR